MHQLFPPRVPRSDRRGDPEYLTCGRRLSWHARLLVAALTLLSAIPATAQVANYVFSQGNVAYADISGTGTLISTANTDNATSAALPIGFPFYYNNQNYTHFRLNTNGFIKLGTSAAMAGPSVDNLFPGSRSSVTSGTGALSSFSANDDNLIAALNADLIGGAGVAYYYETTGAGASAKTVIQFQNVRDNFATNPQFTLMNFQIILQANSVVRFSYGAFTPNNVSSASTFVASVGLKGGVGTSGTDSEVRAVSKTSSGTAWTGATSVLTPPPSPTTSFSIIRTTPPATGQQYVFTPGPKVLGAVTVAHPFTAANGAVSPSSTNVPMLRLTIPYTGVLGPLTIEQLIVDANSSTGLAYITAVKLYYSTASTFSLTNSTLLGTTTLSSGEALFAGLSQPLVTTPSYLHVTYDVAPTTAALGFTLDAALAAGALTITGDGTTTGGNAPAVDTNPANSRLLAYCTSAASSANNSDIGRLRFANLDNSSGGGMSPTTSNPNANKTYSDFTAQTVTVNRGSAYILTVNPIVGGTTLNALYLTAYADYNHSGAFDADELLGTALVPALASGTPTVADRQLQIAVTIPNAALLGTTRLRVIVSDGEARDACGTYSLYGETEDYTLNVLAPAACAGPTSLSVSNLTPTTARINFSNPGAGNTIKLEYGSPGFTPGTGTIVQNLSGTFYDVPGTLTANTSYEVYATKECSGPTSSAVFGPVMFTTPRLPLSFNVTGPTSTSFTSIYDDPTTQSVSGWRNGTSTAHNLSQNQPIGFSFNYLGTAYTEFRVSTEGFLTFNTTATVTGGSGAFGPDNSAFSSSTAQTNLALAPFYDNLSLAAHPDGLNAIRYQTSGVAPSRVLTVEWNDLTFAIFNGTSLNFQVKLYEATGTIEYHYGTMSIFSVTDEPSGGSADILTYTLGLNGLTDQDLLTQQLENTRWFANAARNNLTLPPTCDVKYSFTPNMPYATYTGTTAPPTATNDNCASAIALTLGNGSAVGNYCGKNYTTRGATPSTGTPTCSASTPGTPDDDVWFTFTLPGTANVGVDLLASKGFYGVLQILSGSCGALTPVTCVNAVTGTGSSADGTERYFASNLAAGTYYVRVYHTSPGSGPTGVFALDAYTVPNPPANDNCAGAIPLTLGSGGAFGPTLNATSTGATRSVPTTGPSYTTCYNSTADDDVWFSFTPTSSQVQLEVAGLPGYRPVVQILSSNCAASPPVQVGCELGWTTTSSASISTAGLTPGNPYLIRVFHYQASYGPGDFTIRGRNATPPGNNEPGAAGAGSPYDLTVGVGSSCGTPVSGTTVGATPTMTPLAPLNPNNFDYSADDDVFYSFVVPPGITALSVTVQAPAGGVFNGILQGLDATLMTQVGYANNNSTGGPDQMDMDGLTPGARYYVRVFGQGGSITLPTNDKSDQGDFIICVGEKPKEVSSVSTSQTPSGSMSVPQGSVNQTVLRVQINVDGTVGVLPLQSITFRKGATTDVSAITNNGVRLWRSGNELFVPAQSTLLGSGNFNATTGEITFGNLNYDLPPNNTYLFLTVNVRSTATLGSVIDAISVAESLLIDSVSFISADGNPAGDRVVGPPAPANDEACSAVALTVYKGNSRPVATSGNDANATINNVYTIPSCANNVIKDVWYKLTVPASGQVLVESREGSLTSVTLQLFSSSSGTCSGTFTEVACDATLSTDFSGIARVSGRPPGETLWLRVSSGSSTVGGTFTVTAVERPVWMGNTSISFSTVSNYVPYYSSIVELRSAMAAMGLAVPGGAPNQPTISTNEALGGLSLYLGATVNVTSTSGNALTINGPLLNYGGTFAPTTTANVVLGNTAAGSTGGTAATTFENLTVGPAGLTLGVATRVHRVLTLNGALASNGKLTLLSDAAGTAMVVNTGLNAVTGNATVQRYLDPSANAEVGYRHLASPVQGSTVADLATTGFAPKVNAAYNAAADPLNPLVLPFPNVFGFDESRIDATFPSFDRGWASPVALTSPLVPGTGYSAYMKGTSKPDFVGVLTTGDVPVTVTNTNGLPNSGWNMLGNPYPAPIDWDLVPPAALTAASLDAQVAVFQSQDPRTTAAPGPDGVYLTRANGIGDLTNGLIPMGQGFIVRRNTVGTAQVTMTDALRLTTYANPSHYRQVPDSRPRIALTVTATGTALVDRAYVYFEAGATAGADALYDGHELRSLGAAPSVFTLAAGHQVEELAINGLPELTARTVVPLVVVAPQAGTYTLTLVDAQQLPAGTAVLLRDQLTGTYQDLTHTATYQVVLAAGASAARFALVFEPAQAGGVTGTMPQLTNAAVAVYPNPVTPGSLLQVALSDLPTTATTVRATLLDGLGRVVRQHTLAVRGGQATGTLATTGLSQGVYSLRLEVGTATLTRRVVID